MFVLDSGCLHKCNNTSRFTSDQKSNIHATNYRKWYGHLRTCVRPGWMGGRPELVLKSNVELSWKNVDGITCVTIPGLLCSES